MKLIFAAGDVGGARAILPVARKAYDHGLSVAALDHGILRQEGDDRWHWLCKSAATTAVSEKDSVLIYATSVSDPHAFDIARAAQNHGTPILHVLDNWSNYAARLWQDGVQVIPNCYAVMDPLAHKEACADGVPQGVLQITGHPNLAALAQEGAALGAVRDHKSVLFVSEPAAADNGRSRGYDETQVTQAFGAAWATLNVQTAQTYHIHVAPHPREDRASVAERWHAMATQIGHMSWSLVPPTDVRHALHRAGHVFGMSSILLYEAWLLGTPTASLQPGLIGAGLRTLSHRDGLWFCDQSDHVETTIHAVLHANPSVPQPDMARHIGAAEQILDIATKLAS